MASLAVFSSPLGQLTIHDLNALQTMVNALMGAARQTHASAHLEVPGLLLEGFSIEQWAVYGRRKAAIASQVCRENGKLKAALTASRCGIVDAGRQEATEDLLHLDPVMENDPWAGCSLPASQTGVTGGAPDCSSLWSNWAPRIIASDETETVLKNSSNSSSKDDRQAGFVLSTPLHLRHPSGGEAPHLTQGSSDPGLQCPVTEPISNLALASTSAVVSDGSTDASQAADLNGACQSAIISDGPVFCSNLAGQDDAALSEAALRIQSALRRWFATKVSLNVRSTLNVPSADKHAADDEITVDALNHYTTIVKGAPAKHNEWFRSQGARWSRHGWTFSDCTPEMIREALQRDGIFA